MAFAVNDEDLNGDCFILGTEGEPEEDVELNHVIYNIDTPAATDNQAGTHIAYTAGEAGRFIKMNTYYLYDRGVVFKDALYMAYLRFLATRNGLISPEFTTNVWNVRYNDAVRLSQQASDNFVLHYTPGDNAAHQNAQAFTDAWNAAANVINKATARKVFSDIVCCIAYIFRVRGHHYRADFEGKYKALWSRCLHVEADLETTWQNLATTALHAIMPRILDDFWQASVVGSSCAGALIKRFDSAPAGAAGILALKKGIDDIGMIFPQIIDRVPDSKLAFDNIYAQVSGTRWGASINSRYYGAQRIQYNESDVGALASVVLGVYEQLAPGADLRDSMALQRLAKIAPATGGAIGQAAVRTTRSDRMLLIAPE